MSGAGQSEIQWGKYSFSRPVYLVSPFGGLPQSHFSRFPLRLPGLYAIMVEDSSWNPQPFRPLYFGQSEDVYERPGINHENYHHWCSEANGKTLYVSRYLMIGSTKVAREVAETALIEQYKPPCNNRLSIDIQAFLRAPRGT